MTALRPYFDQQLPGCESVMAAIPEARLRIAAVDQSKSFLGQRVNVGF